MGSLNLAAKSNECPQFAADHGLAATIRSFLDQRGSTCWNQGIKPGIVQHDRDTKFSKAVDRTPRRKRVVVKISGYRAPNTNVFVERFIQSIQQECLDRFVIFGSGQMDQICGEYLDHYHTERPHQGIENELVVRPKRQGSLEETISLSEVRSTERLGGLLMSYWRKAG